MTIRDEQGLGLVLALVLIVLVSGLAAAVMIVSRTETLVAANFRAGREALYAAEGAVAQAVRDLAAAPDWDSVLSAAVVSTFTDGAAIGSRLLPGGDSVTLCCGPASLSGGVQARADGGRLWGADTPQWTLFAWGPVSAWRPAGAIRSPLYVAVWVSDDPADGDGNPSADNNSVLRIHAQALGPQGARRIVEAVVARPSIGSPAVPAPGVRLLSWREVRW
jgi:Tfp pilus assembly protein PilX